MRPVPGLAMLIATALACGGGTAPGLTASGPKLPPPRAIDVSARGAAYLTQVAAQIQPGWGQFLEDCRLRLPKTHPLNQPSLVAEADLTIARNGKLERRIAIGSGNGDFDTAVFDVLGDASPLPVPPADLVSDDELVHLRWTFARDVRQAGSATARVIDVRLPLLAVVDKLVERKALPRAIERLAAAPVTDPDRMKATERVMIETLREGLFSGNSAIRRAAVEAVGRAKSQPLAAEIHTLAGPIADLDLRLAAIVASASLGDPVVAPTLAADLALDFDQRPRIALAKIEALLVLGRGAIATPAIANELAPAGAPAKIPSPTALLALARIPSLELSAHVVGWLASPDALTRAAVCAALPGAAHDAAPKLIARGLRDADATVRARCIDAVARSDKRITGDQAIARRLRELAKDRDRAVRARAIAALGVIEPGHKLRAIDDPAAEIRAASVVGAGEIELRTLAGDKDPEVRATAIAALGDRAPDVATRAITDLSAAVRRAAIAVITDPVDLMALANDDSPDVATAALVRLATLAGRPAITAPLLASLGAAPAGTPARVRIALAWLLAR